MNNAPIQFDAYQQEQIAQQRKKRMLIFIVVLSTFYLYSRSAVQVSNRNGQYGYNQKDNQDIPILDDTMKAQKLLEENEASIDGYKELYTSLYERYHDEQQGKENPTPDLKGNTSQDLFFATLFSLKRKKFDGEWQSQTQNNVLGFFDNKEGHFVTFIDIINKNEIRLYIQVRDDQYIDHKSMIGVIPIKRGTNFTIIDTQVHLHNLTMTYNLQNDFQRITYLPTNTTIPINLMIMFDEQSDSEKYINKYSPFLKIQIWNENRDDIYSYIDISAETDLEEENSQKSRQTMCYAIFLTIILSIQFFFVIKMMKSFLVQENQEQKFSLLSLSIIFIWDGFFCFLHLLYAINYDHQFHYFITPCFLYMILWNIFERGLITIVWRNRHAHIVDENELNKKRICFFVCLCKDNIFRIINKFFNFLIKNEIDSSLILSFFIIQQYLAKQWFIYLVNLYLVPQIIRNVRRGQQVKVCKSYTFGFMMIRSIIILYYRGCPENIAKLSPQYSTCIGIILILIAQVLFLYAQEFLGPRFFIPARFQTDCYNYYYKLPPQAINVDLENQQNDECTICITELTMQPVIEQKGNYLKKLVIRAKQQQNYIMKTPCEHKYHIPCLLKWMEVKMECPTCRAVLPPMA